MSAIILYLCCQVFNASILYFRLFENVDCFSVDNSSQVSLQLFNNPAAASSSRRFPNQSLFVCLPVCLINRLLLGFASSDWCQYLQSCVSSFATIHLLPRQ